MADLVDVFKSSTTTKTRHSESDSLKTLQVTWYNVRDSKLKNTNGKEQTGILLQATGESLLDKSLIHLGLMLYQVAIDLKDNQNLYLLSME